MSYCLAILHIVGGSSHHLGLGIFLCIYIKLYAQQVLYSIKILTPLHLTVLGQLLFKSNSLHITYYLQLNYLVTVTYYPYNKITIIIIIIIIHITLCPQP